MLEERLTGVLLGAALGDALGLPAEGLPPETISRRFGRLDRFRLLGSTGFVSDDTEQAALIAQSLLKMQGVGATEEEALARAFRRSLVGWFLRLPFGIGMATVRACLRAMAGFRQTGVKSAGNGAAMRAAILGAWCYDDPGRRQRLGRALALVTHRDDRAVEGALFVAELAALCMRLEPDSNRAEAAMQALVVVNEPALRSGLEEAMRLAEAGAETLEAAHALGTTGYVVHSVPFALFCWLRFGGSPDQALEEVVNAGGDTDSNGAMVGGWVGAQHGASRLPAPLVEHLLEGPFGRTHLRALGAALARARSLNEPGPVPGYSISRAFVRNLALFPVILAHGFRRLLPF